MKVKPGSRQGLLVVVLAIAGGTPRYTVFLRERPIDGHANVALARTLAAHFGVSTSSVHIRRRRKSSLKQVRIDTIA